MINRENQGLGIITARRWKKSHSLVHVCPACRASDCHARPIVVIGTLLLSHLLFAAEGSPAGASGLSSAAADKFDTQLARCEERLEVLREIESANRFTVTLGLVQHLDRLTACAIKPAADEKSALAAFGKQLLDYGERHRDDPEFQHAVFHADLSGLGRILTDRDDLRRFSELTNHLARAQVPRCLEAAKAGSAYAQIDIAGVYRFGRFGLRPDLKEAAKWYRQAAEQGSALGQWNLAVLYERGEGVTQDFGDALKWYRRAAAQGGARDQNDLAWFLATCSDETMRNGSEAVTTAELAVEATGRKEANYLDTLAAAYAESGRFADAVRTQKEAIALLHDEAKEADFSSRLRLFEAGSPYHQPPGAKLYRDIELEEPER